tara:strand:- start:4663 stop:5391 length:729 start_codon:yes stop_codon:yes gene_type:complete
MKISTDKFLQSSRSKNLDLLSDVSSSRAKLIQREGILRGKSKKITAQNMQLMSQLASAKGNPQQFYQQGYIEGYQKAFAEGFNYAKEQYEPQTNILSGILGKLQKRELGGPVKKGQSYLVGEDGPEVFQAPSSGNVLSNNSLPGLGGGGGGTNAITGKAKSKTMGAYTSDFLKRMTSNVSGSKLPQKSKNPLTYADPNDGMDPASKVRSAIFDYQNSQPSVVTRTVIRTIIQKQGTKIVNRR